jgi:hypothetical protein
MDRVLSARTSCSKDENELELVLDDGELQEHDNARRAPRSRRGTTARIDDERSQSGPRNEPPLLERRGTFAVVGQPGVDVLAFGLHLEDGSAANPWAPDLLRRGRCVETNCWHNGRRR